MNVILQLYMPTSLPLHHLAKARIHELLDDIASLGEALQ